ncbi:hypothetical protein [Rothia santali]|nr:hypothetical protein [Rothia santali]
MARCSANGRSCGISTTRAPAAARSATLFWPEALTTTALPVIERHGSGSQVLGELPAKRSRQPPRAASAMRRCSSSGGMVRPSTSAVRSSGAAGRSRPSKREMPPDQRTGAAAASRAAEGTASRSQGARIRSATR